VTVFEAPQTSDEAVAVVEHTWWGDTPYFLFIVKENTQHVKIDVDVTNWHAIYKDWMRGRMRWYLARKSDDTIVFGVEVYPEDKPWYYKHHTIDLTGPRAGIEWVAYGIGVTRGKKRHGLWITQDNLICDDVDLEGLLRG